MAMPDAGWLRRDQTRRRQLCLVALLFYVALSVGALWWAYHLSGRTNVLYFDETIRGGALYGIAVGVLTGLVVAVVIEVSCSRFRWMARLEREFRQMLGRLGSFEIWWLACWSALGEELFFRGAMQYSWGLIISAIIFALGHFPRNWVLLPWTIFALFAGLLLGVLYQISGNLSAPIMAHLVINLLGLYRLQRPGANLHMPVGPDAPGADGSVSGQRRGRFTHFEE